jgi:hypothetical protein
VIDAHVVLVAIVSCPSPLVVSSPCTRRSHRWPATFNPSQLLPVVIGPQDVKSFGSGILDSRRVTQPELSMAIRFGSRPNRFVVVRSPVAPAGLTGLPARSTVGLFEMALPFWTPG